MDIVLLISRIAFALMFVTGGINHFTKIEAMAGYAQFKKVPMAKQSVLLSGALLLLGGLSVALGVWLDLGAIVLAVVTLAMALKMHDFWAQSDAQAKQTETIGFFKNISMAAGALFMFGIAAQHGAKYGPAITESLWHIGK